MLQNEREDDEEVIPPHSFTSPRFLLFRPSPLRLNYSRKSVTGLSFEYQAYNITGFTFYCIYSMTNYIVQHDASLHLTQSVEINGQPKRRGRTRDTRACSARAVRAGPLDGG